MDALQNLWIGTSGWSYKHWAGVFYPAEVKSHRYLEYYTQFFNCVELNASFYRLPKLETVKGWVERTPAEFKFCPKLSRLITHLKKLVGVEEALQAFFEVFQPLSAKLGPILVQLPPSLRFDEAKISDFLERLTRKYPRYSYALEARHPGWTEPEALDLLKKFGIAWVISHSGDRFPYFEAVTGKNIYLRFHGPDRLYASKYSGEFLSKFAVKICRWLKEGHQVWGFFNNDFGGYAVENARQLKELVEKHWK